MTASSLAELKKQVEDLRQIIEMLPDYGAALAETRKAYAPLTSKLSAFAATTSAELAGVISDETGSGKLVFATNPTLAALVNTGLTDISGAAAGQIKFPATQNPSADANTLDDYEEGSWTPVPASLTVVGTPTYVGKYTKIGNLVICHLRVTSTGTTTCTGGTTSFSGLPFAAAVFGTASFANDAAASLGTGLVVGTSVSPPSWTTQSSATSTFVYLT